MEVWQIKKYWEVFESSTSRKYPIPHNLNLPVSQDSEALRWLLDQGTGGAAAVGHFLMTVEVLGSLGFAARKDGVLVSSGRSLGPEQIAARIGAPKSAVRKSWDLLANTECGWLKKVQWSPEPPPETSHEPATDLPPTSHQSAGIRTEQRRTEQEQTGTDTRLAAPAAEIRLTREQETGAAWLAKKPEWLPEGKPWISRAECRSLARLPFTQTDIDEAYREARDGRKTLDSPAALVISKLRKAGGAV